MCFCHTNLLPHLTTVKIESYALYRTLNFIIRLKTNMILIDHKNRVKYYLLYWNAKSLLSTGRNQLKPQKLSIFSSNLSGMFQFYKLWLRNKITSCNVQAFNDFKSESKSSVYLCFASQHTSTVFEEKVVEWNLCYTCIRYKSIEFF